MERYVLYVGSVILKRFIVFDMYRDVYGRCIRCQKENKLKKVIIRKRIHVHGKDRRSWRFIKHTRYLCAKCRIKELGDKPAVRQVRANNPSVAV